MTSTGERIQRGFLLPYAEIFRDHRARRFSAAGVIGRMPMAMLGLGTVLLISARTGHYGVAGSVAASGSLGAALCAPQFARLVDRFGQRRVLMPLCLVFALAVTGLVLAVQLGAPDWVLFLPGILAGASMPVLGPMVRARWSALLAGSPRLHTAFSLESVGDELCYMVGPAVVTLLATQVHPAAGVTAAAALCLTGTLWFASQRDTEPPPRAAAGSGRILLNVPGRLRERVVSLWPRPASSCSHPCTCSSAGCSSRWTCPRSRSPRASATSRWRGCCSPAGRSAAASAASGTAPGTGGRPPGGGSRSRWRSPSPGCGRSARCPT